MLDSKEKEAYSQDARRRRKIGGHQKQSQREYRREDHYLHCGTTSLVTWLVHPFRLVNIPRLVTRQVTHVTSRVTRLVTKSLG